MKKTTLFTVAVIIFLLMAGYFTLQVRGMAQKKCTASNACVYEAEGSCMPRGSMGYATVIFSNCLALGHCGTLFRVSCEDNETGLPFSFYYECLSNSFECGMW